jgi:hypothetical protein
MLSLHNGIVDWFVEHKLGAAAEVFSNQAAFQKESDYHQKMQKK